jgi:hypothetical protein
MSTVYVVQEPPRRRDAKGEWEYKYDIGKAEVYGSLKILLNWKEARELTPFHMTKALQSRLAEFTEDDYLMIIGSPMAIILSTMIASTKSKKLQVLLHDRDIDDYRAQVVPCLEIFQQNGGEQ